MINLYLNWFILHMSFKYSTRIISFRFSCTK